MLQGLVKLKFVKKSNLKKISKFQKREIRESFLPFLEF